jgi:hypothetical protein
VHLEFITHHLAQLHLVDHAVAVTIPRAHLMMEPITGAMRDAVRDALDTFRRRRSEIPSGALLNLMRDAIIMHSEMPSGAPVPTARMRDAISMHIRRAPVPTALMRDAISMHIRRAPVPTARSSCPRAPASQ